MCKKYPSGGNSCVNFADFSKKEEIKNLRLNFRGFAFRHPIKIISFRELIYNTPHLLRRYSQFSFVQIQPSAIDNNLGGLPAAFLKYFVQKRPPASVFSHRFNLAAYRYATARSLSGICSNKPRNFLY